jgi:hypothetical protein
MQRGHFRGAEPDVPPAYHRARVTRHLPCPHTTVHSYRVSIHPFDCTIFFLICHHHRGRCPRHYLYSMITADMAEHTYTITPRLTLLLHASLPPLVSESFFP